MLSPSHTPQVSEYDQYGWNRNQDIPDDCRDVDDDDDDCETGNDCSHPTCVCSIGIDQDLKENT